MCLGPQHREFRKEILQTMQVGGAPTQKLANSQLSIRAGWGKGPNTENFEKDKEIRFL